MIYQEHEHIMALAKNIMRYSEIDEIVSTTGLFFLCQAKLVFGDYSQEEIYQFYKIGAKNDVDFTSQVKHILKLK